MYIDFKDILKPEEPIKIPQEIINQLNKSLPDGLEYVNIGDSACGIWSKDGIEFGFDGFLSNTSKEVLEQIKTADDFSEYIYRTQRTIPIKPDSDGMIIINGKKVPLANYIKLPLSDQKVDMVTPFLIPAPFPEIGPFTFQTGKKTVVLDMKRMPYESMDTICVESQNENWLKIRILFNEKTNGANINFTFKYELIHSVEELLESMLFKNSIFISGISVNNHEFKGISYIENATIPKKTLNFWKNVLLLEKKLNIKFDCTKIKETEDPNDFKRLFRGLLQNKPYREYIKVLPTTGLHLTEKEGIEKFVGKEGALSYIEGLRFEIMGQTFDTYCFNILFNAVVESIQEYKQPDNKSGYFAKLIPADKKRIFQVINIFRTLEEATVYENEKTKNFNSFTQEMRKARVL